MKERAIILLTSDSNAFAWLHICSEQPLNVSISRWIFQKVFAKIGQIGPHFVAKSRNFKPP